MFDSDIKNLFLDKHGNIAPRKCGLKYLKCHPKIKAYLDNRFKVSSQYTYCEIVKAILYNYELEDKNAPLTDEKILTKMLRKDGETECNYTKLEWLNKHLNYKNYLDNRFEDITEKEIKEHNISYGLIVRMIQKGINKLPRCKVCGKKIYNIRYTL